MRLLGRDGLAYLAGTHREAADPIFAWEREIEKAAWKTPHDLKQKYPKASILGDKRVIFNLMGNKYRIDTTIEYTAQIVLVTWAGTHKEYDKRS
jgi:mRNA interferase HigB